MIFSLLKLVFKNLKIILDSSVFFSKVIATATISSVVAGYRAMLESTVTIYTEQRRLNHRLSFLSIQGAKSDKLQPGTAGC